MSDTKAWKATLVHGRLYTYRGVPFKKGEPQIISNEDKEHLEENAFDTITISSGNDRSNETRQKFEFEPATDTELEEADGADDEGGDNTGDLDYVEPPYPNPV